MIRLASPMKPSASQILTLLLCLALSALLSSCASPVKVRHSKGAVLGTLGPSPSTAQLEPATAQAYSDLQTFPGAETLARHNQALQDWIHALLAAADFEDHLTPDSRELAAYFDDFVIARELKIWGLRDRGIDRGLGVALVGLRENLHQSPEESYYPPEGIARPLTAMTARDPQGRLRIRLQHSREAAPLMLAGEEIPPEADYSAPYAILLEGNQLSRLRIPATINPRLYEGLTGVYLLEPYDPDKEIVLMVHGFISTPATWMHLTNGIWASPELRNRYQIWHYVYSSGLPYPHSAAVFRQQVEEARQFFDPRGKDFATRNFTLVSHSLGGLLCKTLMADSGDQLWDLAFQVSPDELQGDPQDLAYVRELFSYQSRPWVKEAVFVAVPHHGSSLGQKAPFNLATNLVKVLPEVYAPLDRVAAANPASLQPRFQGAKHILAPSGPKAMAASDPFIQVAGDLPIDPRISFHTIVGQKGSSGDSDGVVPHASSHQPGAKSDTVLDHQRHIVNESDEATQLILNVLRER